MKRHYIVFLLFFLPGISLLAQVSINTDGSQPNQAAILDLKSTERGLLPPRMTTLQVYQIANPPAGLLVFNTDSGKLNLFDGTNWHELTAGNCIPDPTTASAGPNQLLPSNDTAVLQGNVPLYGTGTWSVISGTGGAFTDIHNPASKFSGQPVANYTLRWTIATGCGSSTDDVIIRFVNPDSAVYVSTQGSNSNPGTKTLPFQTIQYGISQAVAAGKPAVMIASGNYGGTVNLASSVTLYGGCHPTTWYRSPANLTTITGGVQAVIGSSVTNAGLDMVKIYAAAASGSGASSYGVFLINCQGIRVNNCNINPGPGVMGSAGYSGNNGSTGPAGNAGEPGCEGGYAFCDNCDQPDGGSGGNSSYGLSGGRGGNGGYGSDAGDPGINGSGPLPGAGGQGGFIPNGGSCSSSMIPGYVANGSDGADGTAGTNGTGGSNFGTLTAGGYTPSNGISGTDGTDGSGGGGGGGGMGDVATCPKYGSSGGGGGAGGRKGTAGTAGTGGGGSFGIFCFNSTATVAYTTIITATGGAGGGGGSGGNGGTGGAGGAAGPYDPDQDEAGCGGWGGRGGNGGQGGHGGGGGGGPSVGIVKDASSNVQMLSVSVTPGLAGSGGTSAGNPGQAGLRSGANF